MSRKKAAEIMNTRVSDVSFYTLKQIELQSCNRKTTISHNNLRHCRVKILLVCKTTFLETAVYTYTACTSFIPLHKNTYTACVSFIPPHISKQPASHLPLPPPPHTYRACISSIPHIYLHSLHLIYPPTYTYTACVSFIPPSPLPSPPPPFQFNS